MKVKVLLVAEIEVGESINVPTDVQSVLDNFREAVVPGREYGITLYQATAEDMAAFSASGRLIQPGLLIDRPAAHRPAASQFTHRYPTRCPFCDADLTKLEAIKLTYTIGDGGVHESFSRLDSNGLLVDVGDLVAHGYHSDTICRGCLGSLAEHELAD